MARIRWAIDGTDLESLAFNPVQIGTDTVPALRGSDRQFAYRPGAAHRPRADDSQTITLGMHILGQDDRSTSGDGRRKRLAFERRWRELRHLLRPEGGREFEITKTWEDDLGAHTATGHGIATSGIDKVQMGTHQAKVTVDIHMADPYFYGDVVETALPLGTQVEVTNHGDATTTAVVVELDAPLTNALVTNSTPDPDVWVKLGLVHNTGTAVIDVDQTTVTGPTGNLIGALSHAGSRSWFGLARGENRVTLTATGGTGAGRLLWRPVYY